MIIRGDEFDEFLDMLKFFVMPVVYIFFAGLASAGTELLLPFSLSGPGGKILYLLGFITICFYLFRPNGGVYSGNSIDWIDLLAAIRGGDERLSHVMALGPLPLTMYIAVPESWSIPKSVTVQKKTETSITLRSMFYWILFKTIMIAIYISVLFYIIRLIGG